MHIKNINDINCFKNSRASRHLDISIKKAGRHVLLPLLSFSLLTSSVCCYTAKAEAEPEYEAESSEEGMLSPSSGDSKSVFGGTASSAEPVTDENLQTLLNQLQGQLPTSNGTWAAYVCDLLEESEGSINDQSMQAASLIKLFKIGRAHV